MLTKKFPRAKLAHTPTPLEYLPNLTNKLGGPNIWMKRDDCTGLAMGGNKARQLEFYLGDAVDKGSDLVLTTGAVQSNHVRMTVAACRKLNLDCEVQLEERVSNRPKEYYESGNPFIVKMMGAKVHTFPVGEDEFGADKALYDKADIAKSKGKKPYVIPLSQTNNPLGSLGYVVAAEELLEQAEKEGIKIDAIVVGSGSGTTHSGLIAGLRASGSDIPVYGICVRRAADLQKKRITERSKQVAEMLGNSCIKDEDIWLSDEMMADGYGTLSPEIFEAIDLLAKSEGILLDVTYTGKAMAGMIKLIRDDIFGKCKDKNVVFIHTGGTPAIFGYPELAS